MLTSFSDNNTLGKYTEDRRHIEQTVGAAWQHVCVASLIGHCESIASSGQLTEPSEKSLRFLIAETLSAFGMQSHDQLENELSAIRQVMERA
jgi:hypothetical protein